MARRPLRTTVIRSSPFPGWLEHASTHLQDFGPDDVAELHRAGGARPVSRRR